MDAMTHDYSDVTRLDEHFAAKRAQELQLAAEAARAAHEQATGAVRNERIRKTGVAVLLGGAGVGLALFGASFLLAAQRERVVLGPERVVTVTRDVPGPERIIHDAPAAPPAPSPIIHPVWPEPPHAATPLLPPAEVPEDEAKTPEEKKFKETPPYKDARYRGRIIKSVDKRAISFADGINLYPEHWDPVKLQTVEELDQAVDAGPYVGDLALCTIDEHKLWYCKALHNGEEVEIPNKPVSQGNSAPTTDAKRMVMVDVTVGPYPVEAMVDTGCSFPMSVPKVYADTLIRVGLATRAGSSGSASSVDIIMINSITVDGRTLHGVEAAVSPSDSAPILLGLGALNHLGPYTINNGRLVFTGEQPT